jgi:hypothetical protein
MENINSSTPNTPVSEENSSQNKPSAVIQSEGKKNGSKVGIIILILAVFLVVAGGAVAAVYLVMKNSQKESSEEEDNVAEEEEEKEVTPEEAYTLALAKFTNESYFEYTSEGTLPVEMSIPAVPQLDLNVDIKGTEEGKLNLEDGDSYYLTNLTVDFESSLSEVYYIGGKVYARESLSDDFTEYTQEEASEAGYGHSAILNVITSLADDVDYTVTDNEFLNGREQFTYLVELTQEDLSAFINSLNTTLESEGIQISSDESTVTNANVKIWVDKEDITATKGILSIESLSFTGTYEGYSVNFALNNIEAEMDFSKWGEAEKISLPTATP